jgi:hypothetical protein
VWMASWLGGASGKNARMPRVLRVLAVG